ncbi:hypothetical protein [Terriglobus tenax]|uniref:hypothetical protein n=1 Tax=Terriglobus tenax TaxID=1111115 RepID=UPI0021DFF3B3|nr:hypothetical protein [Terriglobus tenax]
MIEKSERSNAERTFLLGLADQVGSLGFNPKPLGQSFRQVVPTGKWEFHISFIAHKTDFDLTADVAVRVDAIENLVNEYDTKLTTAEKRKSMTLGGELGNISEGVPRRWTISNVEDIPAACDGVIEAFRRVGLPFLQKHSDAAAAHRVLVSSEQADLLLAPVLGPRCMRAMASAYVTGNISEMDALLRRYEIELSETEDLYLEDFRSLAHGLLSRAPKIASV